MFETLSMAWKCGRIECGCFLLRLARLLPGGVRARLKNLRSRIHFALYPLELMPDAPYLFRSYRRLAGHPHVERRPGGWLYVFSSHCLKHIEDWSDALREWTRKIRPGGTLFLYLPHPDCAIWHPGSPFVGKGHKWSPTPAIIEQAVGEMVGEIIAKDDGPDAMQSFYVVARRSDSSDTEER